MIDKEISAQGRALGAPIRRTDEAKKPDGSQQALSAGQQQAASGCSTCGSNQSKAQGVGQTNGGIGASADYQNGAVANDVPQTLPDLQEWLQTNFNVLVGPPKAYYAAFDGCGQHENRNYVVYAFGCKTPEASTAEVVNINRDEREAKVVGALYATLLTLKLSTGEARPALVLRCALSLGRNKCDVYGRGFIAQSAVEDGLAQVPEGWVIDFCDDKWKPVDQRMDVTTVSIRCDVPKAPSATVQGWGGGQRHLANLPVHGYKMDGGPTNMV